MKKLFIIPLIALCAMTHSVSAQVQKSFVVRQPKFCQGFLITDGSRTDIDYWRLIISERTFDSNGFWSDEVIDRIEISDRNYYRIPSEYFVETASHEYMYTVEAWNLTSGKKDEVGPVSIGGNGIPWLTGNRFVCDGTTYAWAIQQDIHPSGCCQYHYSLTDATDFLSEPNEAFPFGTAVPFYEYMFQSDYTLLSNNFDWLTYHSIEGDIYPSENVGDPVIEAPELAIGQHYLNNEGEILNEALSQIIGVQKTKGPWLGISPYTGVVYEDWTGMPLAGTGSISERFNDYSNIQDYLDEEIIDQLLTCVFNGSISLDGLDDDAGNSWNDNCFDAIDAPADNDGDGIPDLDQTLESWHDCLQMNIAGGMEDLQVGFWNTGDPEIIAHYTHAQLYSATGEFTQPTFMIPQGLSSITVRFTDGQQATLFLDLKTKVEYSISLSSLVSFTVFPVPIIGNSYSVHVQSSATLDFMYQVLDMQGNVYYALKYDVLKDHNADHNVVLQNYAPAGVLIHKFIFADGSVKTITTTKQ